jgi:hypothetical protein
MALVLADRVQEYSTTTGTGTLTLSGAYAGFQTFAAGIGNGNTCYYTITSDTNQWEVGIGTVGVGTLARTTLISSSTGSLVSFTGTLTVFVTYPAEKAVNLDAANVITGYPITVADNVFTLQDNVDPTKQAQFQLSAIGTGVTATYTMPAVTGTIAALNSINTWTATNTFSSATNTLGSSAATGTSNVGSGSTSSGNTKNVNIGTSGLSGSTTNITVGSANGSTTTMLGSTVIGGLSGNQSLQVNNVASAVNYAQIVGAVTGGTPTISAQGTDANIDLTYNGKGTGNHYFQVGGATNFRIAGGASIVNYPMVYGSATGFSPAFLVQGSDTNINLQFSSKGTGQCVFYTGSNLQTVFSNTASSVNWLNFTGAATGAAPTISAQGSDANINLVLNSKGTGVVALGGSTVANSSVQVRPTASSVNYLQLNGSITGSNPAIQAVGTDANVGLTINTQGTGAVLYTINFAPQFKISPAASAVNYVQATGGSTGNPAVLAAIGSDTNVNLKLVPQGTGTLQFGTYTAGVVAQAGYITITDAGNTSRRLLVG